MLYEMNNILCWYTVHFYHCSLVLQCLTLFFRNELVAYGFSHLPTSPGQHNLEVVTWKPSGSLRDTISQFYVGGSHQLRNPDLIISSTDRYRLSTTTMGKVYVQLAVVLRNFEKFGVEF